LATVKVLPDPVTPMSVCRTPLRPTPSARSGPRGSVRVRGEVEGRRDDAGKLLGYMATTWVPVAELAKALSGEPFEEAKDGNVGKVAGCVKLAAGMMRPRVED